MQEIFPLACGLAIGLLVQQIASIRLRTAALVVLCLIFGAIASYISGELEVSWGFLSVDMALVWLGALLAVGAATIWRRRLARW